MYSKLSIFNMALDLVPQGPVASVDERSVAAQSCNRRYDDRLRTALEMWPWRFATVRAELAALVTNDRQTEWLYAYALPGDMSYPARLAPWPVTGEGTGTGYNWQLLTNSRTAQTYEIANGVLYTNWPGAILEYTGMNQIESRFPAYFADALAASLAAVVVLPISSDNERQKELIAMAANLMQYAKAYDAMQAPQYYEVRSEVDAVRDGASITTAFIGPRG